jgi:hypothetical protein
MTDSVVWKTTEAPFGNPNNTITDNVKDVDGARENRTVTVTAEEFT